MVGERAHHACADADGADVRPVRAGRAGGGDAMSGPPEPRRLGWSRPLGHLAHANGIPPESYLRFVGALAGRLHCCSLVTRADVARVEPCRPAGLGRPCRGSAGRLRARDLGGLVRDRPQRRRGLHGDGRGRGPGAVPGDRVIDPVLFTGRRAAAWRLAKAAGLARRMPIVAGALRRRDEWASREEVPPLPTPKKPLSRGGPAGCLDDYLDAGLRVRAIGRGSAALPEGVGGPHLRDDAGRRLGVGPAPGTADARAAGRAIGDLPGGGAVRFAAEAPHARVVSVPGTTHMLPMERPEEVARLVAEFVSSL